MSLENTQGVLAIRHGEFLQIHEEKPTGEHVYAVALVSVPLPPEPASPKAEGLAVICAGRSGAEGKWGYLFLEKDTKQEIGALMLDRAKVDIGKWYWLRLTKNI